MAGNSSVYILRQQRNESNLKQWQDWSLDINYVVSQFNEVIQNLQDRLDLAEMNIEALMNRIENTNQSFIKVQYSTIEIKTSKNTYTKSCGVFSYENNNGDNKIYVYANKTVDGLTFDGKDIKLDSVAATGGNKYLPFAEFTGSGEGTMHTIKSNNITSGIKNVELYFTFDSSFTTTSWENRTKDTSHATLTIVPKYGKVEPKHLLDLHENALSKATTLNTPISVPALAITKEAKNVNQFSVTKTAAIKAKNLKN